MKNVKKIFEDKKKEIREILKKKAKKQHTKGKLTAMERIIDLLDRGSFIEIGFFHESKHPAFQNEETRIPRDAVITGYGTINQRPIYVYAQDFSCHGGTVGEIHARKIVNIMALAKMNGFPIVSILDSGGARIEEGVTALEAYAQILAQNVELSGVVPQIALVLGPCAGGAAYSPGLNDFILTVKDLSKMFITGPRIVEKVTAEKVSLEELGGAEVHGEKSGVSHFIAKSEKDCFAILKELLSFLPNNYLEAPPEEFSTDGALKANKALGKIVPFDSEKSYDIKKVVAEIFDKKSFLEVHRNFAKNTVVGFARLDGKSVGVIANQPLVLAGALDIEASEKITRFVNFCDAFNIPLVTLVDVPGYLPGTIQEKEGIIRHGAKMLYAFSNATVPKISLILRKAYGGAYIALASKNLAFDQCFAWPSARIAVMGSEEAVQILFRKEAKEGGNNFVKEKVAEYEKKFLHPYTAAKLGYIDDIINPEDSRRVLAESMRFLLNKRKKTIARKHGNIPI